MEMFWMNVVFAEAMGLLMMRVTVKATYWTSAMFVGVKVLSMALVTAMGMDLKTAMIATETAWQMRMGMVCATRLKLRDVPFRMPAITAAMPRKMMGHVIIALVQQQKCP
jgi:hypothetical protein